MKRLPCNQSNTMYRSTNFQTCLLIVLTATALTAAQPPQARAGDKVPGGFIAQLNGECKRACRDSLQSALASNAATSGCSLGPKGTVIGDITFEDIKCPPNREIEESVIASIISPQAALSGVAEIIVKQDLVVTIAASPTSLWGIDETDGGVVVEGGIPVRDGLRTCSMNSNNGAGVNIWILDTGCQPTNGGACFSYHGRRRSCTDRNGHGSHVGGTATDPQFGVAFSARRSCIKVLSDRGSGSFSDIINGIGYAVDRKGQLPNGDVINLSLGGSLYAPVNAAVEAAAGEGVYVSIAAGNSEINACQASPASASGPGIFTVQAHDSNLNAASFTNFATSADDCTDLSAPGVAIESIGGTFSGTSMAAPHVAGALAVLLSDNVSPTLDDLTPQNVLIDAGPGTLSKEALGLICE